MKSSLDQAVLVIGVCLLAACAPARLDGVKLPADAGALAIGPNLEWITYEERGSVWLAPLPGLGDPVAITPSGSDEPAWSMHAAWMPDSSGVLLESWEPAEDTVTWWLVKVDAPNERHPLCTLPAKERRPLWSPTGDAIALCC